MEEQSKQVAGEWHYKEVTFTPEQGSLQDYDEVTLKADGKGGFKLNIEFHEPTDWPYPHVEIYRIGGTFHVQKEEEEQKDDKNKEQEKKAETEQSSGNENEKESEKEAKQENDSENQEKKAKTFSLQFVIGSMSWTSKVTDDLWPITTTNTYSLIEGVNNTITTAITSPDQITVPKGFFSLKGKVTRTEKENEKEMEETIEIEVTLFNRLWSVSQDGTDFVKGGKTFKFTLKKKPSSWLGSILGSFL